MTTWTVWNTQVSTASTDTADDVVWGYWVSTAATTGTTYYVTVPAAPRQETEAEQQARVERERQNEARWARERAERDAAAARAAALLAEHLDDEQATEYEQHGYFTVISRDGQRRYQIHRGRSGNVREVNGNGHRLRTFCIHPGEAVPDEDTMLAQKLMLEADDPEFFRLANVS